MLGVLVVRDVPIFEQRRNWWQVESGFKNVLLKAIFDGIRKVSTQAKHKNPTTCLRSKERKVILQHKNTVTSLKHLLLQQRQLMAIVDLKEPRDPALVIKVADVLNGYDHGPKQST